jgi:leader peptidase (prepilin peptidase)/N-methyltransferase
VLLDDVPPWFLRIFAVVFGLLWGSFLNVVIYRLPREMSVVRPPSHCPSCKQPIRAWQNVPLFGWLFMRGRARCCGVRIPVRYPLVEAIGGVISLAVMEMLVLRMSGSTSFALAGGVYLVHLTLALGLVAAAFIDVEFMILPDSMTIGGAVLGVLASPLRGMSILDSLIGAAAGFAIVWLPFVVVYPRIRGKVGMGLGDAKLLMLAGAWFGWLGALVVLAAGAVQGTIVALGTLLLRGKLEEPEAVRREREEVMAELAQMTPEERAEAERELADDPLMSEAGEGVGQARIAFGPFLILATLELLLLREQLEQVFSLWMGI